MKRIAHCCEIHCVQCGRPQDPKEGLWMLCQSCGTFRCPSCYGNLLDKADCPECLDREEAGRIVEYLSKSLKTMEKPKKTA